MDIVNIMEVDKDDKLKEIARSQLFRERHDKSNAIHEEMVWEILKPFEVLFDREDFDPRICPEVEKSLYCIGHCDFKCISLIDLENVSVYAESKLGIMSRNNYLDVLLKARDMEAKIPDPDCVKQVDERASKLTLAI